MRTLRNIENENGFTICFLFSSRVMGSYKEQMKKWHNLNWKKKSLSKDIVRRI